MIDEISEEVVISPYLNEMDGWIDNRVVEQNPDYYAILRNNEVELKEKVAMVCAIVSGLMYLFTLFGAWA